MKSIKSGDSIILGSMYGVFKIQLYTSLLVCLTLSAKGQTGGLFNQKGTAKKYLLQQIAALKVYIDYTEKGYRIAHTGLETIGSIKKNHLLLDSGSFHRRGSVNQVVVKVGPVNELERLYQQIAKMEQLLASRTLQSGYLSKDERKTAVNMAKEIKASSLREKNRLRDLTGEGIYQMTDDERIRNINVVYGELSENHEVLRRLIDDLRYLILNRTSEELGLQGIRQMLK